MIRKFTLEATQDHFKKHFKRNRRLRGSRVKQVLLKVHSV